MGAVDAVAESKSGDMGEVEVIVSGEWVRSGVNGMIGSEAGSTDGAITI